LPNANACECEELLAHGSAIELRVFVSSCKIAISGEASPKSGRIFAHWTSGNCLKMGLSVSCPYQESVRPCVPPFVFAERSQSTSLCFSQRRNLQSHSQKVAAENAYLLALTLGFVDVKPRSPCEIPRGLH
jgi:hypothetical protein